MLIAVIWAHIKNCEGSKGHLSLMVEIWGGGGLCREGYF